MQGIDLNLTSVVNRNGRPNLPADVRKLQHALNSLQPAQGRPPQPLNESGSLDGQTRQAIQRFQTMHFRTAQWKENKGEVAPDGITVRTLRQLLKPRLQDDFNIYLINPGRIDFTWPELCSELARIFNPVIAQSRLNRVVVRSTMSPNATTSAHLLIYVLASRQLSIIREKFGVSIPSGFFGFTFPTNIPPIVSEVYLAPPGHSYKSPGGYLRTPTSVALTAYHEAMHNILREDTTLHRRGGLASAGELDESSRKPSNDRDMANAIDRGVANQFVDGWTVVETIQARIRGKLQLQTADPLDGI